MTQRCEITGKTKQVGHLVSHSNHKTKRHFDVNLQVVSFFSETLARRIRLRVSASGVRTVEKHGGIDAYLLSAKNSKLIPALKKIKAELAERHSSGTQAHAA